MKFHVYKNPFKKYAIQSINKVIKEKQNAPKQQLNVHKNLRVRLK